MTKLKKYRRKTEFEQKIIVSNLTIIDFHLVIIEFRQKIIASQQWNISWRLKKIEKWRLKSGECEERKPNAQQPFLAIANFVVSSRSRFARSFIFNGK